MKHEFEMSRKERAQQFHARATFALANHKNIAAPTEQILNEDHGTEEAPNIRPKKVLSKSVLRSLKHPNSLLLPGSGCGLHEHPHTLPDCETKNHPIGADQLTDFDVLVSSVYQGILRFSSTCCLLAQNFIPILEFQFSLHALVSY